MAHEFQPDLDAILRIGVVPTILNVICQTTGMGFATVARVTEVRWVACQLVDTINFGLKPGHELPIDTTICHEIRQDRQPVVIANVAEDETFRDHHTPAMYGFQSYISVPIVFPDGRFFGTLCAIDPQPRAINNAQTIGMFKLFAELIATHLSSDEELRRTRAELGEEREISVFREQFVAVLGHDLRNPIASIDAGARLLLRTTQDEKGRKILGLMQGSLLRVRGLIDNVLDFARARLGEGLTLEINPDQPFADIYEQVISEIAVVHPDRRIESIFDVPDGVAVDGLRLGQLLSNLLGNAITHGAEDTPIRVGAEIKDGCFELWVANSGEAIADAQLANLFHPFIRGEKRGRTEGLGLGLYIASEIARAHGGTLDARSDGAETLFLFRMPLRNNDGHPDGNESRQKAL